LFATGIECSYPTIEGPNGRTVRVDELERTFHYTHWRSDLALVKGLGLKYLRYGPPYYRTHLGPEQYDWEFTDLVFQEMHRRDITPIADLCHFGVPDWVGGFQNPEWPELFAAYAKAFAERYGWVNHFTPVNEIYVCAKFSTLSGRWNERVKTDRAFVTALKNLCKANQLAIRSILEVNPAALFIQSESAEYFHQGGCDPKTVECARLENDRRFLSCDLLFGVSPCTDMGLYLLDNGLSRDEYRWFMEEGHALAKRIILGVDFYERNEQVVTPGGNIKPAGEVFGWSTIAKQYYERYRRPIMHTETNNIASSDEAPRWLWKQFFNVRNMRQQGMPVIGFTWYSLIDQVDWDSGVTIDRGVVNRVGLYDLKRQPHPVAETYRVLIAQFKDEPLLAGTVAFTLLGGALAPPAVAHTPLPKPHHTVQGRPPLPKRASVAIARTTDENVDEVGVEALVREALDAIGGMGRFVRAGQTVLIKPNLTVWRAYTSGVTTDPRVVAALARIVREAGAGTVQVGECSSCGQVTREVMRITGMEKAAPEAGAVPVYFDEEEPVEVDVPLGQLIKRIPVPKALLEADVVIACPKLKTHFLDPVTGAIKLWVGAVRQDFMHRLHRDQVQETVADLLTITRPDLCVMDAIIAGEGNGPVATSGKFVGCILASDDPVAIDVIAADLAGFDGEKMTFPKASAGRAIGIAERARIDVIGVPVESAKVRLTPTVVEGWDKAYPIRIIVGEGVTLQGTMGHFKGFADLWQADHLWDVVVRLKGKPTFMMGRAEDPAFEEHLKEGRYFVMDDAALDKYKHDPRVVFIPGSPIGNEMMPVIMKELGVGLPAKAVEGLMKSWEGLKAKVAA
jgi:uncharacterized protein (DUF362 family)/beta-glucosidase/6-phospho-beta-glucosidase/beta-galactosidase